MAKKVSSSKSNDTTINGTNSNTNGIAAPLIRRAGLRSATRALENNHHSTKGADGIMNGNGKSSPTAKKRNRSPVHNNGNGTHSADVQDWPNKEDLVLWKKPFSTLSYFSRELVHQIFRCFLWTRKNYHFAIALLSFISALYLVCKLDGNHQQFVQLAQKQLLWWGYWVGLGVLSSIGLGTGLHTFVLYLGPHIAAVTLAAYECDSLNFPEPPYPNEIICPEDGSKEVVSLLSIMSKVRVEAFMWGAGTALGELPPYFMARAARLSGQSDSEVDAELQEAESGQFSGRLFVKRLVEKAGFFGILACASIPNPLFDLAGITCGHFLVPFWTFFGATLIGKAVIKMMIQKVFVIIAFNEHHFETFIEIIKSIPYVGHRLNEPFREFLMKQKQSLHRHAGEQVVKQPSWLAWAFEKLVLCMVAYFLVSIVNSMAQSCLERHKAATISRANKRVKKSK